MDMFNDWFMRFAPEAYRSTRTQTAKDVEATLDATKNLTNVGVELLRSKPSVLPSLRMSTCPPLAVDRLIGVAGVSKNLVKSMDKDNRLPPRMPIRKLNRDLEKIAKVIEKMADPDVFVWLERRDNPSEQEFYRAATIVADRLCGAVANPIIRNAQEGTRESINIPVDAVVMPKAAKTADLPVLIEAKSAGDFTNVNKRRKEEATKMNQLRRTYGDNVRYILFLCGYFDSGYLGYEAAEGIDWVWEHRINDLGELGL